MQLLKTVPKMHSRITFFVAMDSIISALNARFQTATSICEKKNSSKQSKRRNYHPSETLELIYIIIEDTTMNSNLFHNICETFAPILNLTDMTKARIKTTCRVLTKIHHMDLSQEF